LHKVPNTLAAGWGGTGSVARVMRLACAQPTASYDAMSFDAPDLPQRFSVVRDQRPVPPAALPEPHERLLQLVNADTSRLTRAGAAALLQQCRLERYFSELFRHAADVGFSHDLIAAIALARLLGGPLVAFLSDDAKAALASLQKVDSETASLLDKIGRRAKELLAGLDKARARGVLERIPNTDELSRLLEMHELFEHLDQALLQSEEHLKRQQAASLRDLQHENW
jgi:hypothetical protein